MATSGLHHTRETPTDSTFAEIQALNKLNDEVTPPPTWPQAFIFMNFLKISPIRSVVIELLGGVSTMFCIYVAPVYPMDFAVVKECDY